MPGLLVVRLADAGVAQLEQASVATLEALRLSSAYRMVLMKNSPFSAQVGQDVLLAHEISDRFYLVLIAQSSSSISDTLSQSPLLTPLTLKMAPAVDKAALVA